MEVTPELIFEAYSRITKVNLYHMFTILVLIDVLSGYASAIVKKDLDSKVGINGLVKHLAVVLLIFLACPYLWLVGFSWLGKFLIYSMSATYGVSIVENYSQLGMPLPKWVGQFFRRVQSQILEVDIEEIKLKVEEKDGKDIT